MQRKVRNLFALGATVLVIGAGTAAVARSPLNVASNIRASSRNHGAVVPIVPRWPSGHSI